VRPNDRDEVLAEVGDAFDSSLAIYDGLVGDGTEVVS
jgi:hypothetical protein